MRWEIMSTIPPCSDRFLPKILELGQKSSSGVSIEDVLSRKLSIYVGVIYMREKPVWGQLDATIARCG